MKNKFSISNLILPITQLVLSYYQFRFLGNFLVNLSSHDIILFWIIAMASLINIFIFLTNISTLRNLQKKDRVNELIRFLLSILFISSGLLDYLL
jgi:hypothetical protein